jgi:hypothetical protein
MAAKAQSEKRNCKRLAEQTDGRLNSCGRIVADCTTNHGVFTGGFWTGPGAPPKVCQKKTLNRTPARCVLALYSQLDFPSAKAHSLAPGGLGRPHHNQKQPTIQTMNKKSILAVAVLAALAVGSPISAIAAPKKAAAADTTDAASKPIPYHGKVASVDATAKTFTIKGKQKDRVFSITDKTVITKDGAAADITAIAAGEDVRGSAAKTGDNWEALKVTLGAAEKAGKTAKAGKKEDATKPAESGATAPAKPAEAAPAPADAAGAAAPAAPAPAAPATPPADAAPAK